MSTTIDQQFIEFVVKSLVSKPDAVSIERRIDEKGVLLELTVDPEDLGRVIGKRGATAQSLRTLLRALGTKNDARYNLKIVDNGAPRPPRDQADQTVADKTDENSEAPSEEAPAEEPPQAPAAADDEDKDLFEAIDRQATDHDDVISKTRKELDELDDLDI